MSRPTRSSAATLLCMLLAVACGGGSDDGPRDGAAADAAGPGGDGGLSSGDGGGAGADASGEPAGDGGASDGGAPPDGGGGAEPCMPGEIEDCYTGPSATRDVGACASGTRTCKADGSGFGACRDEILPAMPVCGSGDLDCNGEQDDEQDLDGDGFTLCDDDCCDADDQGCDEPLLVNPDAYDFPGDALDDDCSGGAAADAETCDASLASNSSSALDHAFALELCDEAADAPFGVVAASFSRADGSLAPVATQHALRGSFGAITPRAGDAMLVLSTGSAAAQGQTNPSYVAFEPGQQHGTTSAMPADWLAANGDAVPHLAACPAPQVGTVYDSIMLTLDVRVPSNARAFSLRAYLLSSEFPEWVCTEYNDQFLVLLDSEHDGTPANPDDGNLAVYVPGAGAPQPVNVNLAYGNTGLFVQCQNGGIGCSGSDDSTVSSCEGTGELAGTGFDVGATGCEAGDIVGGGTGWLTLAGNVAPGETMRLRFALWDTADATTDTVVLLDGFRWEAEPQMLGARR